MDKERERTSTFVTPWVQPPFQYVGGVYACERARKTRRACARAHSCARVRTTSWVSKVARARDILGVNRVRSSCLGRPKVSCLRARWGYVGCPWYHTRLWYLGCPRLLKRAFSYSWDELKRGRVRACARARVRDTLGVEGFSRDHLDMTEVYVRVCVCV